MIHTAHKRSGIIRYIREMSAEFFLRQLVIVRQRQHPAIYCFYIWVYLEESALERLHLGLYLA